jgi:hypothetical protein
MLAVALLGFSLAIVCGDRPVFGLDGFELGLLPGMAVLAIMLFSIRRRGESSRPFAWGFAASLAVAISVYLVTCLAIPEVVRWPVVYYVNSIEPYILDADFAIQYRLSRVIQGLIFGLPQLLLAVVGGVVTKVVAGARRDVAARG